MAKAYHQRTQKKRSDALVYDTVVMKRLENLWFRMLGHMGDVDLVLTAKKIRECVDPSFPDWVLEHASQTSRIPIKYEVVIEKAIKVIPPFDHAAHRRGNGKNKTSASNRVERSSGAGTPGPYLVASEQDRSVGG